VDYSGPGDYRRPPDSYLRLQWLGPLLTRLGLSPRDVVVLEVPGRRTGVLRRTVVVSPVWAGRRHLVALAGESEWVRNVRAAGGRATLGRRQRRAVRLTELPEEQRPPVIRAYVLRWGRRPDARGVALESRYFFGVDPDLPDEQLRAVAPRHPVFVVRPAEQLLDEVLPRSDVAVVHTRVVPGPPEAAYRAVLDADFYRIPLVRALMELRGLPGRLTRADRRGRPAPAARSFRIPDLASAGWAVLAERPGEELVLGTVARPWELAGSAVSLPGPAEFAAFDRPGHARIVLAVRADPHGRDSLLHVETRVALTDEASRRRFQRYWWVVGPFSALIRLVALRRVARDLSRSAPSSGVLR
jgi:hypothetical protein